MEHHRERKHGDNERDAEEQQIQSSLLEYRCGKTHLGHEHRADLHHLEELHAHAEGEGRLGVRKGLHDLPIIEVAHLRAHVTRAARVFGRLGQGLDVILDASIRDEEDDVVGPVHDVPHVGEVGNDGVRELDALEQAEQDDHREGNVGEREHACDLSFGEEACLDTVRREPGARR